MTTQKKKTPGARRAASKPRAAMVLRDFARALTAVSEVGTFGAEKFAARGWLTVEDGVEVYTDALVQHMLDEAQGQTLCEESHLAHAAHVAWAGLARLELMLRQQGMEKLLAAAPPEQDLAKECQSCAYEFSESELRPCNNCSHRYLNLWSPRK